MNGYGSTTQMYQCGFDGFSYDFGYLSIPTLEIAGMPATSDTGSFSMLHDGSTYRFYHLAE